MNSWGFGRVVMARFLPGCRGRAALAMFLFLVASISCERQSVLEKATAEYEAGRYSEAVFLIRHYFKKGGEQTAPLLFLVGKAWLRAGSEAEAEDAFRACVGKDPSFGSQAAEFLKGEAVAGITSGDAAKGRRLMAAALDFEPAIDFGPYNAEVAALYLDRKDFDSAIRYLETYLKDNPKAPGAAEAMINLAAAYEQKGDAGKAIEIYTKFQESYPKSRLASNALWELENLLLKEAETYRANGETDRAELVLKNLASTAGSPMVRERATFLLGEISEQRGDPKSAIRYYREVIDVGSTGLLVGKAKERIEKLQASPRRR
jgi:tetratricopeptide (TPR) repeat protein